MDPHAFRRRIDEIIDQHDAAFRALRDAQQRARETDRGIGRTIEVTREMVNALTLGNDALEEVFAAQDRAIEAALAANSAALALLRETDPS